MIYKLRRKFIGICVVSFVLVFVILFVSIYTVTAVQTANSLDRLADTVSENDGKFPSFTSPGERPERPNPPDMPEGMNLETPFTTRFFTVKFDSSGKLLSADIGSIASVTEDAAVEYAEKVLEGTKSRGWVKDFRYKVYSEESGKSVVFINGADARSANNRFMLASTGVFAASSIVIIVLVVLISGRAVKPAAESYEKQKQFITDAGHELKTPLTLIRTNLDIMESEIGENEWLSDIKAESRTMSELVNRLVSLARMDEEDTRLEFEKFHLSEAVMYTVSAFVPHMENMGLKLYCNIPEGIYYTGNEETLRQLMSILMDNAVKYCDKWGIITVSLWGTRHPILTVDNSYSAVDSVELEKLFDRFYRADRARTYGNGFGIGLSIAKAIADKHHGQIEAIALDSGMIRFQVNL